MNIFAYDDDELHEFIHEICESLIQTESAAEAVGIIKGALRKYTQFDITGIAGTIHFEVEKLPEPYKSRYKPYSTDLLNRYNELLSSAGAETAYAEAISDLSLWRSYWQGADDASFFAAVSENDPCTGMNEPAGKFFYRLVYGYTMLIADEPGHPIGMPFPGGWTVKEKDGEILCPIRDKEKDLPQALCNFCPAIQDPDYT